MDEQNLDALYQMLIPCSKKLKTVTLSQSASSEFVTVCNGWLGPSFDSPQSPESPRSLSSPPDHWEDNEGLTPTNLSPTFGPLMYMPNSLNGNPNTAHLSVSQSPTQTSPASGAAFEEKDSAAGCSVKPTVVTLDNVPSVVKEDSKNVPPNI